MGLGKKKTGATALLEAPSLETHDLDVLSTEQLQQVADGLSDTPGEDTGTGREAEAEKASDDSAPQTSGDSASNADEDMADTDVEDQYEEPTQPDGEPVVEPQQQPAGEDADESVVEGPEADGEHPASEILCEEGDEDAQSLGDHVAEEGEVAAGGETMDEGGELVDEEGEAAVGDEAMDEGGEAAAGSEHEEEGDGSDEVKEGGGGETQAVLQTNECIETDENKEDAAGEETPVVEPESDESAPVQKTSKKRGLHGGGLHRGSGESKLHGGKTQVPRTKPRVVIESESPEESQEESAAAVEEDEDEDDEELPLATPKPKLKKVAAPRPIAGSTAKPKSAIAKRPKPASGLKKVSAAGPSPATTKKASRVKAPKDPDAPSRPIGAYMFFCRDERKRSIYSSMPFGEIGKGMGAAWKELSEEDRGPWADKATADKARYQREMAIYTPPTADDTSPIKSKKQTVAPKPKTPKPKAAAKGVTAKVVTAKAGAPKPRSRMRMAAAKTDSSDEEDGGDESPVERSPSRKSTSMALDPKEQAPLFSDAPCVPRRQRPMRPSLEPQTGDLVAWSPQALQALMKESPDDLDALQISGMPHAESEMMLEPNDGTMNAARVLSVEHDREGAAAGWSVLRLQAVAMDGSPYTRASLKKQSSKGALEYELPLVDRENCDTDQHVVPLEQYRQSTSQTGDQICIPFAAEGVEGIEEEWEGRVWDRTPIDPENYPKSTFRQQCVLWYTQAKTPPGAPACWLLDNEQADTEISPWENVKSTHHELWCKKNPDKLAALDQLRVDRKTLRELLPASDSIALDEDVCLDANTSCQDLMSRITKRLLSTEATPFFLQEPPREETDYYKQTAQPICLQTIESRVESGEYTKWEQFESAVMLLVNNALLYNETDSLPFHLARVLQKELVDSKAEILQHAPALLA